MNINHKSLVNHAQKGFTLIELMVVIVILGILAALVVPSVMGNGDKARVGATKSGLSNVASALDLYKLDNHAYPTTAEGLQALVTAPPSAKNYLDGGYVKGGKPKDAWGNEFQYSRNGKNYELFSFGADGVEGGEGTDADIMFDQ